MFLNLLEMAKIIINIFRMLNYEFYSFNQQAFTSNQMEGGNVLLVFVEFFFNYV